MDWPDEDISDVPGGWREQVLRWADTFRQRFEAHRWVILVPQDQSSIVMPSYMKAINSLAGVLAPLGLDGASVVGIARSLTNYVRGHANLALRAQVDGAYGPLAAVGQLGTLAHSMGLTHLADLAASTSVPDLIVGAPRGSRGLIDENGTVHPERAVAQLFDPGVELMLDGIAALAAAPGSAHSS